MRSSSRPTPTKTSGASRMSARSASGPLPPSRVKSTARPNARCHARAAPPARPASRPGRRKAGRPGRRWSRSRRFPAGCASATYSRSAFATSAGSWRATSRNDSFACASRGMIVLPPGPVWPPHIPLISAVGRAQIRSRVLNPASPAAAPLCPASASHARSSNGSWLSVSLSCAESGVDVVVEPGQGDAAVARRAARPAGPPARAAGWARRRRRSRNAGPAPARSRRSARQSRPACPRTSTARPQPTWRCP